MLPTKYICGTMYHVEYRYVDLQILAFKTLSQYMRKKYSTIQDWLFNARPKSIIKHILKFLLSQGLQCVWHLRGYVKCQVLDWGKYSFAKLKYPL